MTNAGCLLWANPHLNFTSDGNDLRLLPAARAAASAWWFPLVFRGRWLQFGIQVNGSPGDGECLTPACESIFRDSDSMCPWNHGNGGGRVADKCAVDFDIRAGGDTADR